MKQIKVNAPKSLKEGLSSSVSENEAYKIAKNINKNDKNHHAKVENGQLNVQQVLKG